MERFFLDLRHAVRSLWRTPGFTAASVLTLALGIGVNAAIFSLVEGMLLEPLPYEEPDRLVAVWQDYTRRGGPEREWWSYPNFRDVREQSQTLEDLAVFGGWGPTLTGGEVPIPLNGVVVSPSMFRMLGAEPVVGRDLTYQDQEEGREVALLSHRLWQRRFAGDVEIVGRSIELSGSPHTVIGILPRGFQFPFDPGAEVFGILAPNEARASVTMRAIGRLAPGATLAEVRSELDGIAERLEEAYPRANTGVGAAVYPLQDELTGPVRSSLLILMAVVGLVLLIACANLANLLLARGTGRETEFSVRAALGAGRGHIAGQVLAESVFLALLGGAAGVLLAAWGVDLLVSMIPAGLPLPGVEGIGIDRGVLLFTLILSVAAGLVFGFLPAWQTARKDPIQGLRPTGGERGPGSRRLRDLLVSGEMALAVAVLIGAGLLIRSLTTIQGVDPGFDTDDTIAFTVIVPSSRYPEMEQVQRFKEDLVDRIQALPGVEETTCSSSLPLSSRNTDTGFRIVGQPDPAPGEGPVAWYRKVAPGYLEQMGIPLRQGRGITPDDRAGTPMVAVVNESFLRAYLQGSSPLGQRFEAGGTTAEIVGVAGNVHHFGLRSDEPPAMYLAFRQFPDRFIEFAVESEGDSHALVPSLRETVAGLDPDMAIFNVRTMEEAVASSYAGPRLTVILLGLFALLAIVLASVGLYGVLSYSVARRWREMGIRMALGAGSAEVRNMVVRHGLVLCGIGVVVGTLAALAGGRLIRSQLFGVEAWDPLTYGAVALLLLAVGTAAAWLPARRATRVDPVEALRME